MNKHERRKKRDFGIALLAVLASMGLLACGPVAQPEPNSNAFTGNSAQQEPTPTPMPTICIQKEERDGSITDICITPSPPSTPSKYGGDLEEQMDDAGPIHVTVHMNHAIPNSSNAVVEFLEKNGVDLDADAGTKAFFRLWLSTTLIRQLIEMDEVERIEPVGRPSTGELKPVCIFDDQGGCK